MPLMVLLELNSPSLIDYEGMKGDGKCRKKNKDSTEALYCMFERKLKGLYFHDASIRCKPLGVKEAEDLRGVRTGIRSSL